MNIKIDKSKALIFGSSSGIGRGVLEFFYSVGAEIVASSRDENKLLEINKNKNPSLQIIPADLAKVNEARRATELAITLFQKLHQQCGKNSYKTCGSV